MMKVNREIQKLLRDAETQDVTDIDILGMFINANEHELLLITMSFFNRVCTPPKCTTLELSP